MSDTRRSRKPVLIAALIVLALAAALLLLDYWRSDQVEDTRDLGAAGTDSMCTTTTASVVETSAV